MLFEQKRLLGKDGGSMTTLIREERNGSHVVNVTVDKDGMYETDLIHMIDEIRGQVVRTFRTSERAKAMEAFRRYRKEL